MLIWSHTLPPASVSRSSLNNSNDIVTLGKASWTACSLNGSWMLKHFVLALRFNYFYLILSHTNEEYVCVNPGRTSQVAAKLTRTAKDFNISTYTLTPWSQPPVPSPNTCSYMAFSRSLFYGLSRSSHSVRSPQPAHLTSINRATKPLKTVCLFLPLMKLYHKLVLKPLDLEASAAAFGGQDSEGQSTKSESTC